MTECLRIKSEAKLVDQLTKLSIYYAVFIDT